MTIARLRSGLFCGGVAYAMRFACWRGDAGKADRLIGHDVSKYPFG